MGQKRRTSGGLLTLAGKQKRNGGAASEERIGGRRRRARGAEDRGREGEADGSQEELVPSKLDADGNCGKPAKHPRVAALSSGRRPVRAGRGLAAGAEPVDRRR